MAIHQYVTTKERVRRSNRAMLFLIPGILVMIGTSLFGGIGFVPSPVGTILYTFAVSSVLHGVARMCAAHNNQSASMVLNIVAVLVFLLGIANILRLMGY